MDRKKALSFLTLAGETILLVGALMWSWQPEWAVYVFSAGTILFLAGRMLSQNDSDNLSVRRLQTQQKVGALILLISAVAMIATPTWFMGYYLTRSTWFIPFLVFVIIEVYTTFRMAYLDNNHPN